MPNRVEVGGKEFFLGRIPSVYDRRNQLFAMETLSVAALPPRDKVWTPGEVLDQGDTPSCTGHAARQWEFTQESQISYPPPPTADDTQVPDPCAVEIWKAAQMLDMGFTDPNQGATIHSIAKALHDPKGTLAVKGKARMPIYIWSNNLNSSLSYLSWRGPLIIGISWYYSMFSPNASGMLTVDPNSGLAGGHALLAYGLDFTNKRVKIRNSWTTQWGLNGDCYLTLGDYRLLAFEDYGEICAGTEQLT